VSIWEPVRSCALCPGSKWALVRTAVSNRASPDSELCRIFPHIALTSIGWEDGSWPRAHDVAWPCVASYCCFCFSLLFLFLSLLSLLIFCLRIHCFGGEGNIIHGRPTFSFLGRTLSLRTYLFFIADCLFSKRTVAAPPNTPPTQAGIISRHSLDQQ